MKEYPSHSNLPNGGKFTPLEESEIDKLYKSLELGWKLIQDKKLLKIFYFNDFKQAVSFLNETGKTALEEMRFPEFCLSSQQVKVEISSGEEQKLSKVDFLLAQKCDTLYISIKDN